MVTTDKYRVIGTRPIRPDGVDKVTGRANYGADIHLPRLAYGRLKRSPHGHARILSIDASQALALPGVLAVVTNSDIPGGAGGIADLGESVAPTNGYATTSSPLTKSSTAATPSPASVPPTRTSLKTPST